MHDLADEQSEWLWSARIGLVSTPSAAAAFIGCTILRLDPPVRSFARRIEHSMQGWGENEPTTWPAYLLIHSNRCSILNGMTAPSTDLSTALATLRSRWGAAAPGFVGEVVGALATVPLEDLDQPGSGPIGVPQQHADPDRIYSTGFAELDAILGPGGVPRGMGVSLRGDASSGRTTLALRLVAEAQAAGSIVAWLDLTAALDPVEAVARGIRPEWLVVLTPADPDEGLAIAGSLLAGRAVDLLVIDLPSKLSKTFADRLGRLAALARRAGITLLVLEPPRATGGLAAAVGEATGIRLELARRSWIRLGRDVVGQRTEVIVARNRAGPPGRRATLRILYADGGARDACLRRDDLLHDRRLVQPAGVQDAAKPGERTHLECVSEPGAGRNAAIRPDQPAAPIPVPGKRNDATPPSSSPTPPPRLREAAPALRLVATGAGDPRRSAVVERERARRGSDRAGARRSPRDAARVGAPAGAGGDVPRREAGG
jgi:recombination protein RecA